MADSRQGREGSLATKIMPEGNGRILTDPRFATDQTAYEDAIRHIPELKEINLPPIHLENSGDKVYVDVGGGKDAFEEVRICVEKTADGYVAYIDKIRQGNKSIRRDLRVEMPESDLHMRVSRQGRYEGGINM